MTVPAVEDAADELMSAYNALSIDDREIISVTVLCFFEQGEGPPMVRKNRRRSLEDEFGFSIVAYLEVTGTCNGKMHSISYRIPFHQNFSQIMSSTRMSIRLESFESGY